MTTRYTTANGDPTPRTDATTVCRPQLVFAPPADAVLPAASTSTSKSGWVVSGLAAALAVAALSAVSVYAFDAFFQSSPEPVSAPASAPGQPNTAVVAPASPSAPESTGPTAVISQGNPVIVRVPSVVPSQVGTPPAPRQPTAPVGDPVVTPKPEPETPPQAPPTGEIPTCGDLVVCDPIPPSTPNGPPSCGDFVPCEPLPPAPKPCGPACTPTGTGSRS